MKGIKIIIYCFIIFIISCRKVDTIIVQKPITNIFDNKEIVIKNAQEIQFELLKDGIYTLTLGNEITNQVLTREKFNGQIGINKKKIYTKSLSIKYLYLLLEDENKTKIGKTTIIIN
jgi:hypothetical protein